MAGFIKNNKLFIAVAESDANPGNRLKGWQKSDSITCNYYISDKVEIRTAVKELFDGEQVGSTADGKPVFNYPKPVYISKPDVERYYKVVKSRVQNKYSGMFENNMQDFEDACRVFTSTSSEIKVASRMYETGSRPYFTFDGNDYWKEFLKIVYGEITYIVIENREDKYLVYPEFHPMFMKGEEFQEEARQEEVVEVTSQEDEVKDYNKEKFLQEVFMSSEEYDALYNLLRYKRNVLLQGAPGVGKTFLAKRLAYSIIGKTNKEQVEMIQFHQNYSYEDFIMGYKPNDNGFELKEGVFYQFCKKAEAEPGKDFFFIIDEINRGNLSKVFGELMMLIEGDKRGEKIKLAYKDEEFAVPKNIYLLGMMNTADRSLAMMDYALRRRFSFFDVEPAFDKPMFKAYLKELIGEDAVVDKVIDRITDLNAKIADEGNSGLGKGFCIGHSYFCVKPVEGQSKEDWYKAIVKFEISPLLDEYWWDDKAKAEDCKKELLKD